MAQWSLGNHDAAALGKYSLSVSASVHRLDAATQAKAARFPGRPAAGRQEIAAPVRACQRGHARPVDLCHRSTERNKVFSRGMASFSVVVLNELYYVGAEVGNAFPAVAVPIPTGKKRKWLAIVGSGSAARCSSMTCYALATPGAPLTFFRVPYDYRSYAQSVSGRRNGLPCARTRNVNGRAGTRH